MLYSTGCGRQWAKVKRTTSFPSQELVAEWHPVNGFPGWHQKGHLSTWKFWTNYSLESRGNWLSLFHFESVHEPGVRVVLVGSAACASRRTRSFAVTTTSSSRCFWWWWTPVCRKSRVSRTWTTCGRPWCRATRMRRQLSFSRESSRRRCTTAGKPVQTTFSTCSASVEIELGRSSVVFTGRSWGTALHWNVPNLLLLLPVVVCLAWVFGITAG